MTCFAWGAAGALTIWLAIAAVMIVWSNIAASHRNRREDRWDRPP